MKVIISPAKSLDFETKIETNLFTKPRFLKQSETLNKKLKQLSRKELSELMKISDNLASLNYERNQTWETPFTSENSRQAIYSFNGEVFRGIDVKSLEDKKTTITTRSFEDFIWFIWNFKTFGFNSALQIRNGHKVKS
jgi:hypothetical protein